MSTRAPSIRHPCSSLQWQIVVFAPFAPQLHNVHPSRFRSFHLHSLYRYPAITTTLSLRDSRWRSHAKTSTTDRSSFISNEEVMHHMFVMVQSFYALAEHHLQQFQVLMRKFFRNCAANLIMYCYINPSCETTTCENEPLRKIIEIFVDKVWELKNRSQQLPTAFCLSLFGPSLLFTLFRNEHIDRFVRFLCRTRWCSADKIACFILNGAP